MWHCQKCGESVDDSSNICWKCGAARDGTQDPDVRPEPQDQALPDSDPEHESGLQSDEAPPSYEAAHRFRNGANWYFWIAGLSMINSIVILSGSDWSFIIGLGITQVIDVIASELAEQTEEAATVLKLVAFGLDLFVAGIVVGIGVLARKGFVWAFILGMLLYALDGMLFFLVQDWLSIGFHVYALFCIWAGLQALWQLRQLESGVVVERVDQDPSQRLGEEDQFGTQ